MQKRGPPPKPTPPPPGWSDGLPLVPPTRLRVHRMLKGTNRKPSEVLGLLPERQVAQPKAATPSPASTFLRVFMANLLLAQTMSKRSIMAWSSWIRLWQCITYLPL